MPCVLEHGVEPHGGAANRIDLVVALVEAALAQHLVELERVGGIDRIDQDRPSPDVGERRDLGLNDQMIETVVAAGDDGDIDIGLVFHRERIVDRRMSNLVAAFGKPVAQLLRVRGKPYVDSEAASGKEPFGLRRKDRQVLHAGKNDDGQPGVLRMRRVRNNRQCDSRRECGSEQALHHRSLPMMTPRWPKCGGTG